jgi:hypothetical protein
MEEIHKTEPTHDIFHYMPFYTRLVPDTLRFLLLKNRPPVGTSDGWWVDFKQWVNECPIHNDPSPSLTTAASTATSMT